MPTVAEIQPEVHAGDEVLEQTVGLCPHCLNRLEARIFSRNGQVYLSRVCPEHGLQMDLLEEDREYFLAKKLYHIVPPPFTTQTTTNAGCPFDCGLCPEHQQHTCIALIELTNACDLTCPVCYANSRGNSHLDVEDFKRMLDFTLESEGGHLDILQLSGGEPTLHPRLEEMINFARRSGVKYVLLNTNGVRLTRDPAFVEKLAQFQDGFELYLQFDSFNKGPNHVLRGKALTESKLKVLETLSKAHLPTTLVMTVAAGVNDHELGSTVVRALQIPFVRGVSFQPMAYFGRLPVSQLVRTRRVTLSGIIRRLESQMNHLIRQENLVPLPCDPERVAIGYFYRPSPGTLSPMVSRHDVLDNLGQIKNTLRFSPEEMAGILPASACCGTSCCGALSRKIQQFFPARFFASTIRSEKARIVSETTFRITISSFVDAYNFDMRSCQQECVHLITPDLKKIPFSAYNLYHRERRSGS